LAWYEKLPTVTSPQTVNGIRDYLCAFWNWCARKRIVEQFPDVDALPQPPVDTRAWTLGELDRLFQACQPEAQVAKIPGWLWWTALHLFFWDTGERTGATLAAQWADYDQQAGRLFIAGALRKAGKPATYTLKEPTREKLRLMRELDPAATLVFEMSFTLATFYNRYERILKRAGLPTGRRNKPQKMRRSFASHLEAAGGNATEALQHSARSVTEKSYLDPRLIQKPPPNLLLPDVG
jgi:integrase